MILMMILILMLHADAENIGIREVDAGAETGAADFDDEINSDVELALLKYDADTGADQAYDANVKMMLMLWCSSLSPSSSPSSGEEAKAQGWRVLFLLLVLACIIGLAMIVVHAHHCHYCHLNVFQV